MQKIRLRLKPLLQANVVITYGDADVQLLEQSEISQVGLPLILPTDTVGDMSQSINEKQEYMECACKKHHINGSKYPKNGVPIHLFRKIASDSQSLLLKTCLDCRQYQARSSKRRSSKLKQAAANQKQMANSGVLFCPDPKHVTQSGSKYDRDKVPVVLFRKEPDNPKSALFQMCLDCRNYRSKREKERIKKIKIDAAKDGKFFCTQCHKKKLPEERATNLDGTPSILCLSCKEVEKARSLGIRRCYDTIRLELIYKFESSCQKCKCLYLKPPDDGYIPIKLQTNEIDGKRWVDYNGQSYSVNAFLAKFQGLLELRIIQLDHLSEQEQRDRGLLLPDEPYIAKKRNVSRMSSEDAMRLEALKCQNLCCKCHLEETILREKGIAYNSRSYGEREKLQYINQLKMKYAGCAICKFWDVNLIRFFDMDHLNPEDKMECISRIVKDNQYTMDDLIKECNKCQMLCRSCHIIHTAKQKRMTSIKDAHADEEHDEL